MIKQRTLQNTAKAAGVGLHLGQKVELAIGPAPVNSGIVFRRSDLPGAPSVRARAGNVSDTRLASCIEENGVRISTVEHLMSAFAGLGVDNAVVEVSGSEVPIMDGSAAPFVFLVQSAGIEEQAAAKRYLRMLEPVEVREGDKWARLEPHDGFKVTYHGRFDHPVFKGFEPSVTVDFADVSFVREVSRARTFGFMQEVETLRSQGLALGGSLDNAIVMDEFRVLNSEGLRYTDEVLRHKVLDAIGDLYLIGHPIIGAFAGYKSGHALNNLLARAVLAQGTAFRIESFDEVGQVPGAFLPLQPRFAL